MSDTPITLLLVEDDEDDYIITRDLLEEISPARYHVDWAPTFETACAKLKTNAHDVCLLDYRLGEFTGLGVLKGEAGASFTGPVIVLTGQADHTLDVVSMQAGAMDFLVKGQFDARLLERSIRYAMERKGFERKLQEQATIIEQARAQLAMQNERLRDDNMALTSLAANDGLTDIPNHRTFQNRLAEEFEQALRYKYPLSLLVIDIDHFKSYNDSFGHPAGDEALRQFAAILRESAREGDVAARYGGEEFVMILSHTEASGALILAERLRRTIETYHWPHRGVTASIGISSLDTETARPEMMIARADQALYRSKGDGRNRITHFREIGAQNASVA
ncbi:GGDEF domain-containing response regulator [Capsulimonas corticalis]|nr:diguanylate cyclase [Capsulimonas corticalis]